MTPEIILQVCVAAIFGAVFVCAMRRGWELTAIVFGFTLLLYGCNVLGVK